MKKFGYIYKYNPSEGMGILVYGVWKVRSSWGSTIKNTPVLFSDNDLLSEVSSGKLVFFDLNDDKTVSNIERASLANFNLEYINNIIRCKDGEMESSFYRDNTTISFECLDNIIIPNEDKKKQDQIADDFETSHPIEESDNKEESTSSTMGRASKRVRERGKRIIRGPKIVLDDDLYSSSADVVDTYRSPVSNSTTFDGDEVMNDGNDAIEDNLDDEDLSYFAVGYGVDDDSGSSITETDADKKGTTNKLPNSIVDLYNCFGKYTHSGRKDSTSLNVLDLSLWIDSDDFNNDYYGNKVKELLFLYDLFVLKKRYDKKGNEIPVKLDNDCISPSWSLLLSKLSEEDLKNLICEAPKLQPALPLDFCKNNVDFLTSEYGMPNVEICKLYCLHKISTAESISDYKFIKHKLYVYRHCNATHLEGEGTPMCKMGKTRIRNLEKRLEEQFENVIKKNVIAQLVILSNDANVVNELKNSLSADFDSLALFIESYNKLKNNFLEYDLSDEVLDSYEKLSYQFKEALKTSLLKCVNESAISAIKSDELSPFRLTYNIEKFGNWVLDSTKQKIKELVNERFSMLDDTDALKDAYKAEYITERQYCNKYKEITCSYNAYEFLKELFDYKITDSPVEIQWYVVSRIIKQLGYKSLYQNDYNYIKIEYTDSIYDISSLLKWLASYGNLNDEVLKKAEEEICSVLSSEERLKLFEEKIIQSPGIENIRERLDNVYKNRVFYSQFANKEPFNLSCFQDVMLSDMEAANDPGLKLLIADNLDSKHQFLMQQKATGFIKLYLWQKQPSDEFDWNLIKSHYHELPAEAQIKTLRYIFGKISSGDFSMSFDELYSVFVETTTPACPAICGILCMLKAKKNNLNLSITPSIIESVIGEEEKQRIDFLKDSKELFYPCHGYLAISANKQDIDYQTFNGFLTKDVKNDELYYVIHFYDSPVDLFGRTIDWLIDSDYVETAKQVLLKNTNVEIIEGKFYIHESLEYFVKQFMIAYDIDDKCGLVSDKERMIELGYLPRNNAYQPLYTNYIRIYDESDYYVCRCGCFGDSDPHNNIPFFWCNKKMCVRRAHFLLPSSQWEKYHFADLLFIALGQSSEVRESVWRVNSEISQFICDYEHVSNSDEKNICSKPLNETEERGSWDESSSIYREIYDDEDDGEYNEDYEDYSPDQDEPTYDRYNGSYAQDEMGYSDDEIDTIFDGDPDAYWNID